MPISTINQNGLTNPLTSVAANTVTSAAATALTLQSAGTTAITISTAQNVGIGTSSPLAKLNVQGSTTAKALFNITGYGGLEIGHNADFTSEINQKSGQALLFKTDSTERMRIDSSGNVGVNNTSPAVLATTTQVAIKANINGDSMFVAQNSNGLTTAKFGFQYTGSIDQPVIGSQTNHPFLFLTNNTERMRIDSSGNVGIGTASPDQKLVVSGNTTSAIQRIFNLNAVNTYQMSFHNSVGEVGTISTGSGSTAYNTSSDYRLKENVVPMTNALATVAQLKPCTYTWKSDGKNGQGFIAHELQAVVPQCVTGEKDAVETYTDEDGNEQTRIKPQGVDTSFLVATLTAAIQEQQALIENLTTRLNALEGK